MPTDLPGPAVTGPAPGQRIAVVGMAGRFPGAGDVRTFWQNLRAGTVSIARFAAADLIAEGRDPAEVSDPRFVGAEGVLDGIELFDAAFFGYSPGTAAIMDPQHRIGLEVAWHTLEDAGCDPRRYPGTIGVFAGTALSSYLIRNLLPDQDLVGRTGGFSLLIHNDKDYAATTIAHKLGLTGPAMAIGTACSSSLVAVHLACQSLHAHECDMALAGGISLQVPPRQGYHYDGAGIYSPDGTCRPFDAAAAGTVGGSGAAMVALKRLDDAVADGDRIHAVIAGTAVNNDGGSSAGYTAPSADGQLSVIAEAHAIAGVPADSIGLVEAHGTGTPLGDAVEIDALTQAFRLSSGRTRFCAIGSVKANVGHLDTAAGVASLIKAALAVRHGIIPPHPTFAAPSSHVDWESTPFYVNRTEQAWPAGPRRAGVSSFGIGGTNAHVVVEQPPAPAVPARPAPVPAGEHAWHLLPLSAADPDALTAHAAALADRLRGRPAAELAAVGRTLAARRCFSYRHAVVARDGDGAAAALTALTQGRLTARAGENRPVVFMFPGQGAEFRHMAAELFTAEPAFRRPAEECADLLAGEGVDLRAVLATGPDPADGAVPAQLSLFACEYAIARALQGWGIEPTAVIGHSLGEYAAATLAGALPLAGALRLIAGRSRLLDGLDPGGMLAVSMPEHELLPVLPAGVSLAAVNGPDACVAAGPPVQLAVLAAALARAGVPARPVDVNRPFHSCLVEPVIPAFAELAATVTTGPAPGPPGPRWVSTVTGDWVAAGHRPGPEHWVSHLREPVRFEPGLRLLLAACPDAVFLEAGPSTVLSSLLRRHPGLGAGQLVISTQGHRRDPGSPHRALLAAAGQVWAAGGSPEPAVTAAAPGPLAADLPLYPFRRDRHWVDPPRAPAPPGRLDGLAATARQCLAGLAAQEPVRGIGSHPGLRPGLDQLCASLALRYLGSAGASTAPGAVHERERLLAGLGVLPDYARFADYLLAMLGDEGAVDLADGQVTFTGSGRLADAATAAASVKAAHPGFAGLVELLTHAAAHYPEALSVPGAALQVLYPDGEGGLLRRLLGTETADFSVTPHLLRAVRALVPAVAAAAPGRPLRVLEVGAGTGRLTWELAEALAPLGAGYLVTDISLLFVRQLRDEAAARGADIATRQLDISRDPAGQGLAGQRFDLIVGLDVVHATPDIPAALRHLSGLLAPGGTLALVETVAQDRWLSMVWGLSADWWGFTDQRAGTPIMTASGWAEVMAAAPYAASAVIPGDSGDGEPDAALILAQAPAAGPEDTRDALAPLAALPGKQPDLADWCHLPGWRHSAPAPPRPAAGTPDGCCLVLADGGGWDGLVAGRLRGAGLRPVIVRPGDRTEIRGTREPAGTLAAGRPEDYELLLDQLAARGLAPRYVVHLWNAGPAAAGGLGQLAESQERGLFSLLRLVRAVAGRGAGTPVRLLAVTSCAQEVLGGELTAPERSTVHAAAKVISVEYPDVCCSSLDVPAAAEADAGWLADRVVDELLSEPAEPVAAYRGRHRWVPSYSRWRLPPGPEAAPPRPGGSYLICGGLGGIGLSLARFLGGLPAKVALVRRTPFPAPADWDGWLASHPDGDATAGAIRVLREVESRGGEVLVLPADVADLDQMRAAVHRAVARFGPLTGVVHAAGVRDMAGIIGRRSDDATWQAMAAKVRGPLVLREALDGQRPDFVLYCSSISTILHKLKFGEVGYVAGNEFLNAWAASEAARGRPGVISVAWTDWLESGMWQRSQDELAQRYVTAAPGTFDLARDLLRGLTTPEAVEVFRRLVARPPGPVAVISGQSLDALLTHHAGFSHSDHVDVLEAIMRPGAGARGRRGEQPPYQAPRTPRERAAADVWASVLGIEAIGMHDDFFELGGDSLIALRLLARLRESAGVHRSITDLFRAPTLAGLLGEAAAADDDGAGAGPQHEVIIL